MTTGLRTRFLSAFIFFVLIASAAFTVPARADSGSPPAPPAPSGAVSTSSNTSQNVTQVSSTVTNIAVENNTGHKVNLSGQKAAYISQTGDPVWCPSSMAAPTPGAGACTTDYGTMALLIAYLAIPANQKTVDGTIWIDEGGSDASGPNILEGSTSFATMAAHQLTFKGGWSGIGGVIHPLNPSVLTNNLYIDNWNNNINVSNITIQNSPGDGLVVYTTKNISLTGVTAYHNGSYGVYLDNTAGTGSVTISKSIINQNDQSFSSWGMVVQSRGAISLSNVTVDQSFVAGGAYLDNSGASNKAVVITSSNFDNNQGNGLLVISKGAITLATVVADGNSSAGGAYGAKLDNSSSTTAAPVTLTGLNIFNDNHDDGLDVYTKGAFKSNGFVVSSNVNGYGVSIKNDYLGATGSVTLAGFNTFASNNLDGLNVHSNGAITLNSVVSASNSNGYGVFLVNSGAITPQPVTITGTNTFASNKYDGLNVSSRGAITLSNTVSASNTSGYGVYLYNNFGSPTAGVTLLGSIYTFASNSLDGLNIHSFGAVKLNNITSSSNSLGYGVYVSNSSLGSTGGFTLTGTNTLTSNKYDGLHVSTNGAIVLSSITTSAANTSGYGVYLSNNGATSAQPVTLSGNYTLVSNYNDGLNISSKGAIKLNFINASGNTHGNGVYVNNVSALTPQPITFTGTNVFSGNYYDGLDVFSKGAIKAGDLGVIGNGTSSAASLNGAELENDFSGAAGNITLTGTNVFNSNYGIGLKIGSKGAVTLNSIVADQNTNGEGLLVDNSSASPAQPVTLTGTSEFKFNLGDGLDINSKGLVSLKNITADDNFGTGEVVNNTFGGTGAPKAVTLSGYGVFNINFLDGLSVTSFGAITTNNLTANENGLGSTNKGASLINNGAVIPASVTLNGFNVFNGNDGYGLSIQSMGAVKVNSVTADKNKNQNGVYIYSGLPGSVGAVTLTGTNVFEGNHSDGLSIITRGAISLSNITADDTVAGNGIYLDNSIGGTGAPKPVAISGKNVFNDNGNNGLYINTYGAIILSNLTANGNASDGAYIVNSGALVPANVTLTGQNNFNNNTIYGLFVSSKGTVSMTRVTADDNTGDGLFVGAIGKITLTCGSFVMNTSSGVYFTSPSTMTLIGVNTFGNGTNIITTGGGTANYIRSCPLP